MYLPNPSPSAFSAMTRMPVPPGCVETVTPEPEAGGGVGPGGGTGLGDGTASLHDNHEGDVTPALAIPRLRVGHFRTPAGAQETSRKRTGGFPREEPRHVLSGKIAFVCRTDRLS